MSTLKNLTNFPFAAIIGQEEMKLALQLNVIDPKIGGVMIMGDRGTGKSTTIRALADLLPDITIIKNDPFNTDPKGLNQEYETEEIKIPMVELPLGATEDRVCGSLDTEQVLKQSGRYYQPGLLAQANRGFVYVDEVNLLEDNLVDTLLDSIIFNDNTIGDTCFNFDPPCDLFSSTMSYDYNIWLTVTDSFGCIDSTMQTATVLCQPIADFDSTYVCLPKIGFRA